MFLAFFRDYSPYLAPGEVATIMVIAADRKQARTIMRYVKGFIQAVPMLAAKVLGETRESIELTGRVVIEIHTASFRGTRGYTLGAAICDEVAVWRTDDSAEPDKEIIASLQPALATVPGALLIGLSSPRARRGVLWEAHERNFGRADAQALYWQAASLVMNPSLSKKIVDAAYGADPANASAEYGAQFRTDLESIFTREALTACTVAGRIELPPAETVTYSAFVDPSGGSADSFTLAIAHRNESGRAVLDCLREVRPPFSPSSVVTEFCTTLRSYGVTSVSGDRYSAEWCAEQFRQQGIDYVASEKTRSEIYLEFLPILNSGCAELLKNARLGAQLTQLERRVARGGRDSVDHPPSGHDDLANAAAGAMVLLDSAETYEPWAEVLGMPSGPSRASFEKW